MLLFLDILLSFLYIQPIPKQVLIIYFIGPVVRGRKLFCHVTVRKLRCTGTSVVRFVGMATSSVNRMVRLEEMTELDAWDK
jgi:hypothetical protein